MSSSISSFWFKGLKNKNVKVGEEAEFTVETFHAGEGDLVIELLEPDMNKKQVCSC